MDSSPGLSNSWMRYGVDEPLDICFAFLWTRCACDQRRSLQPKIGGARFTKRGGRIHQRRWRAAGQLRGGGAGRLAELRRQGISPRGAGWWRPESESAPVAGGRPEAWGWGQWDRASMVASRSGCERARE
jgi:hypothetical protein